jgi:hypothetical protein
MSLISPTSVIARLLQSALSNSRSMPAHGILELEVCIGQMQCVRPQFTLE